MSSVITISQPPVIPGDKPNLEPSEGITFAPAPDSDEDVDDFDDPFEDAPADNLNLSPSASSSSQTASQNPTQDPSRNTQHESDIEVTADESIDDEAKQKARVGSLVKLQGGWGSREGKAKDIASQDAVTEKERKERDEEREEEKDKFVLHPVKIQPRLRSRVPVAIIVLKEEKVSLISPHKFILMIVTRQARSTISCVMYIPSTCTYFHAA
jgi:hypothetical protein